MDLRKLLTELDGRRAKLDTIQKHWEGRSPAAFLSKDSRTALDDKVTRLGVNFPALVVRSMVDRLKLRGFRAVGTADVDAGAAALMRSLDIPALAELVHTDRQLFGAAYATVWRTADGAETVAMADSPLNALAVTDPATGHTAAGLRTWTMPGSAHAVIFTPEEVRRYAADTVDGGPVTAQMKWKADGTDPNALGVVPMVPFIRRSTSTDYRGTSAVADILDLTDALSKALADAMVNSEYFAKPRRWATGLEIEEDEDGNPVDPFGPSRFLQSESPDTKFGQLSSSAPTGQTELVAMLTQNIGALTGLPPHYLGLHGDQPANAEGVRAAETQLVSSAYSEIRGLSRPWSRYMALALAVEHDSDPRAYDLATEWDSPEIKTPAQAADAAQKLRAIGVPLKSLLSNPLDFEPHEVEEIMGAADTEAVKSAAMGNLTRFAP